MIQPSRRKILLGAASTVPLATFGIGRARAAEFVYKFGTDLPVSHPLNIRVQEAAERIAKLTDGRFELKLFPNNQLGASSDMISQTRSGALEFFTVSGGILSPVVPAASISGVGFAFKDTDSVWRALDGSLGAYVRGEMLKRGLIGFEKIWDNGFRHVTSSGRAIRTPDDLQGFKIRVPLAPLYTSLFQGLGASPTSINLAEVYSALQTKIVDGQENPLSVIVSAKFFEVQKTVSLTGHIWDGAWLIANKRAFEALPDNIKEIVVRELNTSALDERADVKTLNMSAIADLKSQGMTVIDVDQAAFRDALKRAGFYAEWQKKFGETGWTTLESAVGTLS